MPTTNKMGKPINTQINAMPDHMTEQRQPASEMLFVGRSGDVITFQVIDDDGDQHSQSTRQLVGGVERVKHMGQRAQAAQAFRFGRILINRRRIRLVRLIHFILLGDRSNVTRPCNLAAVFVLLAIAGFA